MADATPVEIHGYFQNRVYDLPGDSLFFQEERVSVSAIAHLPKDMTAYTEVYYMPWLAANKDGIYLESAYADMPFLGGHIRVGKGRGLNFGITPSYPNRKTSNYGMVAEEFTQDRIIGAQYYQTVNDTYYGLTVQVNERPGTRTVGDPGSDANTTVIGPASTPVPMSHLADRDVPGDLDRNLAVVGRISHQWKEGLRLGASAMFSSETAQDLANYVDPNHTANSLGADTNNLATIFGQKFTSTKKNRLEADGTYQKGHLVIQGELFKAEDSSLDRTAWDLLAGWETKSFRFYTRYGQDNIGVAPLAAYPATWSKKQLTLSAVKPISQTVWLQLEQEFNTEEKYSVKNNVTFLELFTGF